MSNPISFEFIQNTLARWIDVWLELFDFMVGQTFAEFLTEMIHLLDMFPFLEMVNIVLIPVRNIIDGTAIGSINFLEFILGFNFVLYIVFVFARWIWDALPVV